MTCKMEENYDLLRERERKREEGREGGKEGLYILGLREMEGRRV